MVKIAYSTSDHPRVCGENIYHPQYEELRHGSPPRVRGKLELFEVFVPHMRITPACAGKTRCRSRRALTRIGSPPRVRGKQIMSTSSVAPSRITPACAGKTTMVDYAASCVPDHPRVCGENYRSPRPIACQGGSPPRVRGKPRSSFRHVPFLRITPACAGKTHGCQRCGK